MSVQTIGRCLLGWPFYEAIIMANCTEMVCDIPPAGEARVKLFSVFVINQQMGREPIAGKRTARQ